MSKQLPTTYVRVDLGALRHNFDEVKSALTDHTQLCAVVKANAYGHGLARTARLFAECGCDMLGVVSVDEGIKLCKAGLETPILVFHPPAGGQVAAAIEHRLTLTVTQIEHVVMLAEALERAHARIDYHIGVDVGLGRGGCRADPVRFLGDAQERLGFWAAGVWTHLGPRMAPDELPEQPPATWSEARDVPSRLRYLEEVRLRQRDDAGRPIFHVAASGAICDGERLQWDMVRVGTLLYGVHPSFASRRPLDLRPTIELRTRIAELRTVPRGTLVGYGGEFRTRRETHLATIPVGLCHGVGILPESTVSVASGVKRWLARWHGARGRPFRAPLARVRGQRAPLVGRISLNECTIDVTDVPGVGLGDEVIVPARMTTLNPTIPRVYVDDEGQTHSP